MIEWKSVGLIGAMLAIAGCAKGEAAPQGGGVPVKVQTAVLADTDETSEFVAEVKSRNSVELRPQVEGHVSKILVQSGAAVTAGAQLLQIDPQKQQAAFTSAAAASGSAEAELSRARSTLAALESTRDARRAALRLAETEQKRSASLLASNTISQQAFDQSQTALDQAKGDFDSAAQQVAAQKSAIASLESGRAQAQASAQVQRAELKYYNIAAPFNGTVGDIPVKIGDFVTPQTLLTTLDDPKMPLEAYISVPVEQQSRLKLDLPVRLVDADSKLLSKGAISFIAPRVDSASQTVLVKARIDDASQLRTQQLLRARIVWKSTPQVSIPTTSLSRQSGLTFVYVLNDANPPAVAQRPVKLGSTTGNDVVVLDGVKPGERFVTAGIQKLRDGAPVTPEAPTAERAADAK
ncbi:efflux RND transporter periplasmic adaptor subunit [Pendulispora brunnea]|uniref:Efflux RND transporter periplasmic adaptor subunit n=1 Tax=Pendulispora brunnea TaxID=2905690 RepID=A0ABZ2KF38_9BACT